MAETLYRRLQREIAAIPECAEHVHTNEMPRLSSARDKDQAIADILNARGVVGTTRPAAMPDVQRTLILHGAWRRVLADAGDPSLALQDLIVAQLPVDFYTDAATLLDQLQQDGPLTAAAAEALRALCRAPITAEIVSRAVRGPWED